MARRRILNILLKEWQVLFTDLNSALMITIVPLLIVGQGALYVWLAYKFGGETMLAAVQFQNAIAHIISASPAAAQLPAADQLLILLLTQFNFYLLLIPTMIAISAATFSLVDEKQTGSLEALLATPIRTWELLLGKALAGAVPALIMTWLSAGIFLLIGLGLGWQTVYTYLVNPAWLLSLFLLTPAVAILSFILGVMGSARAKDAKSAQNMIVVVILPVFALIAIQVTGIVWFTPLLTFLLGIAVLLVDLLVLKLAVKLFRRESILSQWR